MSRRIEKPASFPSISPGVDPRLDKHDGLCGTGRCRRCERFVLRNDEKRESASLRTGTERGVPRVGRCCSETFAERHRLIVPRGPCAAAPVIRRGPIVLTIGDGSGWTRSSRMKRVRANGHGTTRQLVDPDDEDAAIGAVEIGIVVRTDGGPEFARGGIEKRILFAIDDGTEVPAMVVGPVPRGVARWTRDRRCCRSRESPSGRRRRRMRLT